MKLQVIDYEHKHAAAVAQMWNESDAAWPWSFTGGIPMDAKFVQDWIGRTDYTSLQLALEGERVLGFCLVTVYPSESDCCYVQLLNVTPESHGKGVGRELLRQAVEKAAAGNFRRIDLNTWASNKKAVPLYKKCGFFWLEDTSVYMQNYVPQIMNTAAGKEFFARHNWYDTQVRDLEVVEDCQLFQGNAAYCYRWQAGDDVLEVIIDRNSQQITALGTRDFYAAAWADPVQLTNSNLSLHWKLENRSGELMPYVLVAKGEAGVKGSFQQGDKLKTSQTLSAPFQVQGEEGPEDKPRKVPAVVETTLVAGSTEMRLITGVRPVPKVRISTGPDFPWLKAGGAGEITVNIHEVIGGHVQGTLRLAGSGIQVPADEESFILEPGQAAAFTVQAQGLEPGCARLLVVLELTDGTSVNKEFPVAVLGSEAVTYRRDSKLILENLYLRVETQLKGGKAEVYDKATEKVAATIVSPGIGPNYWPSEFLAAEGEALLGDCWVGVRMVSGRIPGLEVERRLELKGSTVIARSHLFNRTGHSLTVPIADGAQLDWTNAESYYYQPLRETIIRGRLMGGVFPAFENEFPDKVEDFPQQWLAVTVPGSNRVGGIAWNCTEKNSIFWQGVDPFYTLTLSPGETAETPGILVYWGSGDWRSVQEQWQHHYGSPQSPRLPVRDVVDLVSGQGGIAADGGTLELQVYNRRNRKLAGALHLRSQTCSLEPAMVNIKDINLDNPGQLRFSLKGRPGLASIEVLLETEQQTFRRWLPALVTGANPVSVSEGDVWQINNGCLEFSVAPGHCGAIVNLMASGTAQLLSTYPESGTFGPFNPWYGGIHPVIMPASQRFPGKLHKVKPGIRKASQEQWQGVELHWPQLGNEKLNGLELKVSYLTLPGVNVLAVVRELLNPARLAIAVNWGLSITPHPGQRPKAFVYASADGSEQSLRLGTEFIDLECGRFVDVIGACSQRILSPGRITVNNTADGLNLRLLEPAAMLRRGENLRTVDYLVLGKTELTELNTELDGSK